MKFRKIALAAAAVISLAAPSLAHAEWLEAKSRHFIVYGNMPEPALRQRIERLEKFDAALRSLFKVETSEVATIYVTSTLADLQRLRPENPNVAGFYVPSAQGATGFVPERMPDAYGDLSAERILFHEYAHHMLLSNTTQYFPGWVSEGLAELFMSARFDDSGNIIIGRPNTNRGYAMFSTSRWTARRLIESDVNPPKGDERIELYSRGWLMCHYLLISGKRPGQFFKFIEQVNAGAKPLEAAERAFGDLDKLEVELERYLRAATLPSSLISAASVKANTDIVVRSLGQAEADMMPYRLASAAGVSEQTAVGLVDKARPVGARYPSDAFVQRALAEMEFDARNLDAAEAAADRALAIEPDNVMALIYKGRAIAMRAVQSKDANQWRAARRLFLRANQINPDFALPFQLYYDSFVAAGQPAPAGAVNGLRRAVMLVPADVSIRVRTSIELIRAGEIPTARMLLVPVALNPHAGENPYTKLVAAMNSGADKEALLAKAAELGIDRLNEFDPPKPAKDGDDKTASDKAVSGGALVATPVSGGAL